MASKPRKKYAKKTWDVKAQTWTFAFTNKKTIVLKPGEFPQEIQTRLMGHGGLQKIGDSWAEATTTEEAYNSALETIAHLRLGEWKKDGDGGFGLMVNVIAWGKNVPADKVREALAKLDEEDDEALAEMRAKDDYKLMAANYKAAMLAKANPEPGELKIPGLD